MSMTEKMDRVEVITSVQRRRRWSAEEKARVVQETYAPGMSVSLVARQHGIAPNQLFSWRRLYAEGALSAVNKRRRRSGGKRSLSIYSHHRLEASPPADRSPQDPERAQLSSLREWNPSAEGPAAWIRQFRAGDRDL